MSQPLLNTVIGAFQFQLENTSNEALGNLSLIHDKTTIKKFFDLIKEHGFNQVDTARAYADSEAALGSVDYAKEGILVDTKIASFTPGDHHPDKIRASLKQSLADLKTKKVHILYLHAPDRTVPLEDVLRTINDLYKEGSFEKFGLSNYTAEEIEKILQISKENNYVRPTVYQGNYNIFTRNNEEALFPLLKREKISFYAYSPVAGGFLNYQPDNKSGASRFEAVGVVSDIYRRMYFKDSYFEALEKLKTLSEKFGLNNNEIALRWIYFHSQLRKEDGDAVIIGASARGGPEQFKSNFDVAKKGPLSPEIVKALDEIWAGVKADAPSYHF